VAIVGDIDRLADEDRPWLGVRTARFVLVTFGLTAFAKASRLSRVIQLICRLYPLGVVV